MPSSTPTNSTKKNSEIELSKTKEFFLVLYCLIRHGKARKNLLTSSYHFYHKATMCVCVAKRKQKCLLAS